MKLKVLFYANKPDAGIKPLLASLVSKGYDYSFIGHNEKWYGFGTKLNAINSYLKNYIDSSYTHIMVLDAYDLILIRGNTVICKLYTEYFGEDGIVFSAETNCYPDLDIDSNYPLHTKDYIFRYLNAGSWIAPIDKAIQITNKIKPNINDQRYFTNIFCNTDEIKLDYTCILFQTLYNIDIQKQKIYSIVNNKFKNIYYNTDPCVLHGNGKYNMEYLIKNILT